MTQKATPSRNFHRPVLVGLTAMALIIVLAACSAADAPVAEPPTQAVAATAAPTQAPAPTEAPTATAAPTEPATETATPTQAPVPTEAPTATEAPTLEPTATEAPTEAPTQAPAPSAAITFAADVRPILDQRCVNCHGGKDGVKGGLSMRSYDDLMKGGDDGAAIVPGDPDNSLLVQLIVDGEMPKRAPKLPQAEIDVIAAWVAAGAQNN